MTKSKLYDELGPFVAIPESIIELTPEIGTNAVVLFLYFRYRTNKKRGEAWPGYERMKADLGWGEQKIAKVIRELESAGLIEREKRYGRSTKYTLKYPQVAVVDDDTASPVKTTELEPSSPAEIDDQFCENHSTVLAKSQSNKIKLNKTQLKTDSRSMTANADGRSFIDELSRFFEEQSGIEWPDPKTKQDWAEVQTTWLKPLNRIATIAEWNMTNAKNLIVWALQRADGQYTVSQPKSIMREVQAIKGEIKRHKFTPPGRYKNVR